MDSRSIGCLGGGVAGGCEPPMWVPGTVLGSSVRTVCVPNHWDVSPVPGPL